MQDYNDLDWSIIYDGFLNDIKLSDDEKEKKLNKKQLLEQFKKMFTSDISLLETHVHEQYVNILTDDKFINECDRTDIDQKTIIEGTSSETKTDETKTNLIHILQDKQYHVYPMNIQNNLIVFLFKKQLDNTYQVVFCNSGDGREYHRFLETDVRYRECIFEYNNITLKQLIKFLATLLNCTEKFDINYIYLSIISCLVTTTITEDTEFGSLASQTYYLIPQKSKKCVIMSLFMGFYYLIKSKIVGDNPEQQIMSIYGIFGLNKLIDADNDVMFDQRYSEALLENRRYYKSLIIKQHLTSDTLEWIDSNDQNFFESYTKHLPDAIYNGLIPNITCLPQHDIGYSEQTIDWNLKINDVEDKLSEICEFYQFLIGKISLSLNPSDVLDKFIKLIFEFKINEAVNVNINSELLILAKLPFNMLRYIKKNSINMTILKPKILEFCQTYLRWDYIVTFYDTIPTVELYKYSYIVMLNMIMKSELQSLSTKIRSRITLIHNSLPIISDIKSKEYRDSYIINLEKLKLKLKLKPTLSGENIDQEIAFIRKQKDLSKVGNAYTNLINNLDIYPIIDGNMHTEIDILKEYIDSEVIIWANNKYELFLLFDVLYQEYYEKLEVSERSLFKYESLKSCGPYSSRDFGLDFDTEYSKLLMGILLPIFDTKEKSEAVKYFNNFILYLQIMYSIQMNTTQIKSRITDKNLAYYKFDMNGKSIDARFTIPYNHISIVPIPHGIDGSIINCHFVYELSQIFIDTNYDLYIDHFDITRIKNAILNKDGLKWLSRQTNIDNIIYSKYDSYSRHNTPITFPFSYIYNLIKFIETEDDTYLTQHILIPFFPFGKKNGDITSQTFNGYNVHIENKYIDLLFSDYFDKINEYVDNISSKAINGKAYHIFMCIISYIAKATNNTDLFNKLCDKKQIYTVKQLEKFETCEEKILFASICFEILIQQGKKEEASMYLFFIQEIMLPLKSHITKHKNIYPSNIPKSNNHVIKIDGRDAHIQFEQLIQIQLYNYIYLYEALYLQFITKYNDNIFVLPSESSNIDYKFNNFVETLKISHDTKSYNIYKIVGENKIIISDDVLFIHNPYSHVASNKYELPVKSNIAFFSERENISSRNTFHIFDYNSAGKTVDIRKPYFVNNINLINDYDWTYENNIYNGKKNKNDSFLADNLRITVTDDFKHWTLVRIRNKINESNETTEITEYLSAYSVKNKSTLDYLKCFNIKDDIMIWLTTDKRISSIDLISYKVRLEFYEKTIKVDNKYYLVHKNDDWTICRWVKDMDNVFLIKDDQDNYYLMLFGYLKFNIKPDQLLNSIIDIPSDASNSTKYYIIPIHNILHIPHTEEKEALQLLFYSYIKANNIGNILDMYSHFKNIWGDINWSYTGVFEHIINNIHHYTPCKFSDLTFRTPYEIIPKEVTFETLKLIKIFRSFNNLFNRTKKEYSPEISDIDNIKYYIKETYTTPGYLDGDSFSTDKSDEKRFNNLEIRDASDNLIQFEFKSVIEPAIILYILFFNNKVYEVNRIHQILNIQQYSRWNGIYKTTILDWIKSHVTVRTKRTYQHFKDSIMIGTLRIHPNNYIEFEHDHSWNTRMLNIPTSSLKTIMSIMESFKYITDKSTNVNTKIETSKIPNIIKIEPIPYEYKKVFTIDSHLTRVKEYNHIPDIGSTFDHKKIFNDVFERYYKSTTPNITTYYFIQLLKGVNDLFNIFYYRLLIKYIKEDEDLQKNIGIILEKYLLHEGKFTVNPMEFYYQIIYGYFIKPDQHEMIDKVFNDVSKYRFPDQTGGNILRTMLTYESELSTAENTSRIHTMIMGGGKTSMITPIVILRYIQCQAIMKQSSETETNDNIFLILPNNLISQSLDKLTANLSCYFPINVEEIIEDRENVVFKDKIINTNNLKTTVYIMSDSSLKCALINSHKIIKENFNKNIYIFDEVDTILNPITSELNYPNEPKLSLKDNQNRYDTIFTLIFNVLKEIYHTESRNSNTKLRSILDDGRNDYVITPHFRITAQNGSLIQNIINKFIKPYFHENLPKNINNLFSDKMPSSLGILSTLDPQKKQDMIDIIYTLYQFIEVLPTVLTFTSRGNFGITKDSPIIVPFAYVETPIVGSQFSNPIMVLALTIIEYIVQTKKFTESTVQNILITIKTLYLKIFSQHRTNSSLYREFSKLGTSISLDEISNISQLGNEETIDKFTRSIPIIEEYCRYICGDITFSKDQSNVAGIDLIMSFNFKNKSGFTGTPEIPDFHEFEKSHAMTIIKDPKTELGINNIILDEKVTSIKKYFISLTTKRKDYLDMILNDHKDIAKVLIDIGKELVGITYNDVFELVRKHYKNVKKFVYWNTRDKPILKLISNGNESYWDKLPNDDIFYYYDNPHITGIDAKIPNTYVGIALLGTNSIYRDVVQGIYRMRKIGKGQTIIFVMTSKTELYVKFKLGICRKDINNEELLKWFKSEGKADFESKEKMMKLQNLRALFKNLTLQSRYSDYRILYEKITNPFYVRNTFYYSPIIELPSTDSEKIQIISGKKTNNQLEVEQLRYAFREHLSLYDKLNVVVINKTQTQMNKQEVKAVAHEHQHNITFDIQPLPPKILGNIHESLYFKTVENCLDIKTTYTDKDGQNRWYYDNTYSDDDVDKIVISYNFKANDLMYKYPYFVITDAKYIFIIPFCEGIKLLDSVKRTASLNNFMNEINTIGIFDMLGTMYYNKNLSRENIFSITSLDRFFALSLNPKEYISIDDLVNILYSKPTTLSIFKKIYEANQKDIKNDVLSKFFDCIKEYDPSLSNHISQFSLLAKEKIGTSCSIEIERIIENVSLTKQATIRCILTILSGNYCVRLNSLENQGLDEVKDVE